MYYAFLLKAGASAEMHTYIKGDHGFSVDFPQRESLKYLPD